MLSKHNTEPCGAFDIYCDKKIYINKDSHVNQTVGKKFLRVKCERREKIYQQDWWIENYG